jgi:hypothetical protein
MTRYALHTYSESFGIENFSIAGNQVRMGSRLWQADECRCGLKECEGWEMIPILAEANTHHNGVYERAGCVSRIIRPAENLPPQISDGDAY